MRLRRKALFVFVIVLFSVLILELSTRLFLYVSDNSLLEPVVPLEVVQLDEKLGWSLRPFSKATSERTGSKIEYSINSKGLRDEETTYEKPRGKLRIALIGDSYTLGFGVAIEEHFSYFLQEYYNNVEVVNLGVHGYGIDQELLYLRSEGFRYDPDIVLVYVPHYGDHRHMHAKRWRIGKPRFVRQDGQLVLINSPVENNPRYLRILSQINRWFGGRSQLYQSLRYLYSVRIKRKIIERKKEDGTNFENSTFRTELNELGEEIIKAMHEESSKHGSTFVLVTQMKALHEVMSKAQIISADVSMPLSETTCVLPRNLGHHNEAGNRILAREIINLFEEQQLIPAAYFKQMP